MEKLFFVSTICANVGILYGVYQMHKLTRLIERGEKCLYIDLKGLIIKKELEMKEGGDDVEKLEGENGWRCEKEKGIEERLRRVSDVGEDDGKRGWGEYIGLGRK